MKKIFTVCLGLILFSNVTFSQFRLEIEIVEFRNNTGKLMLQLFDENEKVITQEIGAIADKKCVITLNNIKPGKYGVRYFQDENLNGLMDTNLVGKPTEGYGFSNNAIGKFGPPPFEKWIFNLTKDKKITLKPTY
jgi:uncharacterized protein (DUF2141 family)